ncbi:mucosal addressin cell adhesion molecule 1 [Spea bombifrons]|uniref:mucosal addressin cell adhesion molecule 1 n=1 Tax=Spea bombifrons TaxID=233779 RepID=UPI00234AB8E2|nr:mucosal addressin cell adhesion molecule 1 [Spea bombifrons]
MAPFQSFCIIVQLVLLCTAQNILNLHPVNPVVSLGGSINLNCSINCQGGSTSWKGLDTNLGHLHYGLGYSILAIQNATISMEGIRVCVGSCPGVRQNFYGTVRLEMYALPEYLHLTSHIKEHSNTLNCSIYGVYPASTVLLSWFRGSKKLEISGEEMLVEEGNELINLTSSIEEKWLPGTIYRCKAELSVGDHVFSREGTIQVPNKAENTTTGTNPQVVVTTSSIPTSLNTEPALDSRTTQVISERSSNTFPNQKAMDSLTWSWKTHGSISHSPTPTMEEPPNPAISIAENTTTGTNPQVVGTTSSIPTSLNTERALDSRTTQVIAERSLKTFPNQKEMDSLTQSWKTHGSISHSPTPTMEEPPNPATSIGGLKLLWISLPTVGIMGSLLLILQLWRRISRGGSFKTTVKENTAYAESQCVFRKV